MSKKQKRELTWIGKEIRPKFEPRIFLENPERSYHATHRVAEKEQTISSMQKQIEELKRRAEQGSQQLQGEVMELELESLLRTRFPRDTIEPVPKGVHGGDVLHFNELLPLEKTLQRNCL